MAAEENRIANLKTLVDRLASESGGKLRQGYRAVATATGLDEEYIYQLYKGIKKSMGPDAAKSIARAYADGRPPGWFDLPPSEKSGAANVEVAPMGDRRIPVISAIQAGMWAEIVDSYQPGDASDWLLTDIDLSDSAFALDIRGNSMEPEFKDGDRVIIDPEVTPQPGDFVAAKNGEQEATFKKYRPRGMDTQGNIIFELVPLNDDYPTLRSDVQHIRIVGTMVEHRKYRRAR